MSSISMKVIAKAITDFPDKFGVPRQSGLVQNAVGKIVFEPEFRNSDALRGIDEFSYLWLIWGFSQIDTNKEGWSPTVRPPRLGGNKRMGVFATRSPFRPNNIGLSSVKLEAVREESGLGTVLYVSGVDLVSGTPVYDIKPYLRYVDCHIDANDGFAADATGYSLDVICAEELKSRLPKDKTAELFEALSRDPRPSYQNDPERIYGMKFCDWEVKFCVKEDNKLYVIDILNG